MEKFKLFFLKNNIKILQIQILTFLVFIVISVLFNLDSDAHKYYNNLIIVYNIHSVFSILMIILFAVFFWITIVYPILWVIQIILMHKYKIFNTKKILLIILSMILYIISIIALFSLYSIDQHQGFIERGNFR